MGFNFSIEQDEIQARRILVVDDDQGMRRGLSLILTKQGFEVFEASGGEQALEIAHKRMPDVLLLDLVMPDLDGIEVCRQLRKDIRYHLIYIIMLTVKDEIKDKVLGLECGADDYMTKPFDPRELLARVKNGIHSVRAKRSAMVDQLTSLYNRDFFDNNVDQEMARAKRYGQPLSLILLDIDRFKSINDNYGHPVGDQILKKIASLIHSHCRTFDLASRWGGEEFIILLPNTRLSGAMILAERIRQQIARYGFSQVGRVTLSAGVVEMNGDDATSLFKKADQAMYLAKKYGRNQVVAWGDLESPT